MTSFRCGTVALAGRPNTGKSSLLNRLIGQKLAIVSPKAQTTRHVVTGILTTKACQYVFVDLPGYQTQHINILNRSLNRQATEGAKDCDVAVFVVEALRFGEEDREVLARIPEAQTVVLAINKVDLAKNPRDLLPFVDRMQKLRNFAAIVPVSARSGRNAEELLRVLAGLLPEGPAAYPRDQLTDLGDELPYRCDVALESFKKEGRLRRIEATIWVERDSQKPIVIGAKGDLLKRISTAARKDMESLFGGKVYLGVWIKVKKDWTGDERLLRQLGYR